MWLLEAEMNVPVKLGQQWIGEVAPGVYRLGTTYVGCYAVEEAGAYTFFDTGLPGYWQQMVGFLAIRGAPMSAVEAVVLTHHHDDHKGNAERFRKQAGARVLVHQDDLAATLHKGKIPTRFPVWKPHVLGYGLHVFRAGAARVPPVVSASGFADDEVLDLPGRPRVIHAPGHTPGNAALYLADREVLIVGDALATIDLVSSEAGPRLLPRFANDDHDLALASLDKIEPVNARWILPGHGLPWQGSPQQAVKLAREIAAQTAPQ
jgi:glyoxylase-like metal-dependent hydrolase (beta-lactamase superfamily II)